MDVNARDHPALLTLITGCVTALRSQYRHLFQPPLSIRS